MIENFYAFFEDINYASEEKIREYRGIYLPYVKPMLEYVESPLAIDIGCGRGEWLQMLNEIGFKAKGIDIEESMLSSAKTKGLDVDLGDGIDYLYSIPTQSVAVLSAFHVLEHLPFERITEFFQQSKRILIPGGVLIAETPNPENLHVATSNFYLDPTHIRPIPILQMISFAKFFEYKKYTIIRMQEDKELYNKSEFTFQDLYFGVSKDYALIAQKTGGEQGLMDALDNPMNYETGISVGEVIKRLDGQMSSMRKKIDEMSEQILNIKNSKEI